MASYFEILTTLGYKLQDRGKNWSARALYRDGDNEMALSIHKKTGAFYDFVTRKGGGFKTLVALSLGQASEEDVEKFLISNKYEEGEWSLPQPEIKQPTLYDVRLADLLVPDYGFFNSRGVGNRVLESFGGGLAGTGQMLNRFVFPIYNERKSYIYGFAGRDITGKSYTKRPKWKLIGQKRFWVYPLFLNRQIIHECREIILVESIGDMLALWEAGFRNVLVLFGVALTREFDLFGRLVSLNPRRIIVALNNDKDSKKNNGQIAAEAIKKNLSVIFDQRQILIAPPTLNDFGVMNSTLIKNWYATINQETVGLSA